MKAGGSRRTSISCCCPLLSKKDRGKIRETHPLDLAEPFLPIEMLPFLHTCFENLLAQGHQRLFVNLA